MNIGYVGLGEMGGALARRLQLTHPLRVFDLDVAAVARMAATGAAACDSLADLGRQCDVVFLCLPTSEHVRAAVQGAGGLAAALPPGACLVDQTTGDPAVTRALAGDLAQRGIRMVDAPVSGGAEGAEAGTIAIMVGAAPEDLTFVMPVLRAISSNIFHAGGVGAGHVMKLVNNMLSAAQRLLSFEAVALAAKNGIAPGKAVEILLAGGAKNAFLEKFMGPQVIKGDLGAWFSLALMHKDVRLACQMGSDSGVPLFYGNLTRELYQMCIAEMGAGNRVNSAALVMDRLAGTKVVPADAA